MKKKMILAVLAVLMTLGLVTVGPVVAEDEQDFMQVSPRVWVLDGEDGTTGTGLVTIHIAIPYSLVNTSTLNVDIVDSEFGPYTDTELDTFADLRGDLVIKFLPETNGLEEICTSKDPCAVKVEGEDIDGDQLLKSKLFLLPENEDLTRYFTVQLMGPMGAK